MSTLTVNDIVVGMDFSKNGKNHLNVLTGNGEFTTMNLTFDYLEPHISYRFKEPEEREIEKALYYRDFSSAFDKIIVMTEQAKKKDLKKALKLLDLCKTKVLSSSKINSNGKNRFKEEIKDVTYFIPQNLNTNITKEKKTKINNLMLNCQILSYIQNNSFNEISAMENQIIERIDQSAENIDISTLKEVINIYLLNDYKRGINFAIGIGKIYKRQQIYEKFQDISKMILSPTTFEVTINPSLSESAFKQLSKKLEDSEYIFSQFSLLRDVICSLWEPDSASKIISIIEQKNRSGDEADIYDILPQSVLRVYLNSILSLDKVVKFFTVTNDLLMIMHKNQNQLDFQQIVKELINGIGFEKYKEISSTMPVNDLEDSVDDKDILNYLEKCKTVIISTLNISFNSVYLSIPMCDIMFNILKTFSVDVENLLKKIIISSSAVSYSKQILQSIERDPKKATVNDINVFNNENEKEKEMILKVRQKAEQLEGIYDKFIKSNKEK